MDIGVLGLQGDVTEHVTMLMKILKKEEIHVVKTRKEIEILDGLIMPGGESTTIEKLMKNHGIDTAIKNRHPPIFGTCAGSILLAKKIVNSKQSSLKLMDIKIERNAYGNQSESFEIRINIPILGKNPFKAIFIRAPIIREVDKEVEILAEYRGNPILARQDQYFVSSFHPELTNDIRIHKYFITEVVKCAA